MKHAVAGLVLAVAILPAVAQPQAPSSSPARACFLVTEMHGWKAPDSRTVYIRVGFDRIYRLDIAAACPLLTMPAAHLITRTRGPSTVCSAVDWDLAVSEPPATAMPEHCIVKQMTLLTQAEATALPPNFVPH